MSEPHPLRPLDGGVVVIVGAKASNFDDEIRNHPRVHLWSSQEQHWTNKPLPANTKAVFVTKWVGHVPFGRILAETRKRGITLFNQEGTGLIARHIRELLAIPTAAPLATTPPPPAPPITPPVEGTPVPRKHIKVEPGKLHAFVPYIDWSKNDRQNARLLIEKAKELGITTTEGSLSVWMWRQRQNRKGIQVVRSKRLIKQQDKAENTSIEMFDKVMSDLKDLRAHFMATMKENSKLRAKLEEFKRLSVS